MVNTMFWIKKSHTNTPATIAVSPSGQAFLTDAITPGTKVGSVNPITSGVTLNEQKFGLVKMFHVPQVLLQPSESGAANQRVTIGRIAANMRPIAI
ncbi:MAG TPA: hypothetical protein VFE98_09735 [Candidatus Bathyarchaeia archaeon]|nr:hypothetical protein [Candidatus Bathyarchaeia archaeon]